MHALQIRSHLHATFVVNEGLPDLSVEHQGHSGSILQFSIRVDQIEEHTLRVNLRQADMLQCL